MGNIIDGFEAISLAPRVPSRNFPIQVEGYDTTGPVHFVLGIDLSSGHERRRVRVFLRDIRKESASTNIRAGVIHYATDPYVGLTETDFRDRAKMDKINASLEAKCFTPPGGVLLVQSAFDDTKSGALSAYWLNRIVTQGTELTDGSSTIFSPAIARLSTPVFPQEGDTGKTYCYVDVLHPEKAASARTHEELAEQLFQALSVSPTSTGGKFIAVVRLVDTESGSTSSKLLERRAEKDDNRNYVNESPAKSIGRFWSAMPDSFLEELKSALASGRVAAIIVPGTRYRLVGKSLEAVEKESSKRIGLPYERFSMGEGVDAGFLNSTVVLKRHKPEDGHVSGDEDYFVTAVYPMTTGTKGEVEAVSLRNVTF